MLFVDRNCTSRVFAVQVFLWILVTGYFWVFQDVLLVETQALKLKCHRDVTNSDWSSPSCGHEKIWLVFPLAAWLTWNKTSCLWGVSLWKQSQLAFGYFLLGFQGLILGTLLLSIYCCYIRAVGFSSKSGVCNREQEKYLLHLCFGWTTWPAEIFTQILHWQC